MWGLSKEELYTHYVRSEKEVMKATLRHVYEEGESLCLEHLTDCPRRNCHWCWAELKKEGSWGN